MKPALASSNKSLSQNPGKVEGLKLTGEPAGKTLRHTPGPLCDLRRSSPQRPLKAQVRP